MEMESGFSCGAQTCTERITKEEGERTGKASGNDRLKNVARHKTKLTPISSTTKKKKKKEQKPFRN
jgi:hypothetical protein